MEAIYSALDVDSYHCFLKYVRNIFSTSTGLPRWCLSPSHTISLPPPILPKIKLIKNQTCRQRLKIFYSLAAFGLQMYFVKCSEKAMATHSSTLAWRIPWTEECSPWGHEESDTYWATSLSLFTFMHWRRKWQPTPVFLPEESQEWWSLVGCHLWGRTESNTTEAIQQHNVLN